MIYRKVLLLGACLISPVVALPYPGEAPSKAGLQSADTSYVLENNVLKATWKVDGGKLRGPAFQDKKSSELFSPGKELFGIATQEQAQDPERVYLSMRRTDQEIQAQISNDGKSWETLASLPLADFSGKLKSIRVGKTSRDGQAKDLGSAGELGTCELQQVQVLDGRGSIKDLTAKPKSVHKSKRDGTSLEIANEQITINAHANSATFAEYKVPTDWQRVSCQIKKGTDKGLSWGPGLTLQFDDGSFALVNIRAEGQFTIQSPAGEILVNKKATASLACDLTSEAFTLSSPVKELTIKGGKAITATLKHSPSGMRVSWSAELRDGSNYISQSYTLASTKELTLYGLQFIQGSVSGSRQIGMVPGSPVASDSMFFGVEMPFTANYFDGDSFRSGFPCNLPIKKDTKYDFKTVMGVYPKGQLRRAFSYYLERERATPYHQLLHYNCWYDFAPTREAFTQVIKDYYRELTVKRGVVLDSFVMDDGWDDYGAGLWEYNRKKFPNGFDEVSAEAIKSKSNLGVWISPLGGYGGANERTAHAKKMGLIESTLDLSQPAYYKWFYEKCLAFMKDHQVNYYKWDKAGRGVSPHFMALIQCGRELKKYDPKLFINVTVGTWPSPFWLNHIDCTWRTGTGDVAWMGVGGKREQWLTFRDWGCYSKFVQKAPLYPLNSVMHHGLVVGRHYQAGEMARAGAGVNMKNAARSYFGTGANLLELYLTPEMMTDKAWDEVAEAAKWAKKNEKILVDTHWVGGDPLKLGVYGWASWSPEKSLITLRNSSDKPSELTINLTDVLEVPEGQAVKFKAKNAYKDQTFKEDVLSGEYTFKLQPFEVLCLELFPVE